MLVCFVKNPNEAMRKAAVMTAIRNRAIISASRPVFDTIDRHLPQDRKVKGLIFLGGYARPFLSE